MSPEQTSSEQHSAERGMSRAGFLRASGLVGLGAFALPALNACSSSASSGTKASAGSTGGGGGKELSADDIATVKKFIGPLDPKFAGAGEAWKIGGIFPFSTSGSVYGAVMGNGAKLAVKHIKALGGPNIDIDFRDSAGGDPVKTRDAFIAYANLPAVLSSYEVGGLVAKDLIAKNHNFCLDPGGGNAPPGDKLPYFWGMRASWGLDGFKLAGTYFAQKLNKPKFVLIFYNVGAASDQYVNAAKSLLQAGGAEVVKVVLAKAGATDYSSELTAIRSAGDFDAISLGIDGNDIAYFLKQYKTSGINKPLITWEGLLSPTAKIAGTSAYEGIYLGGVDDFSVGSPNPWAQVFIKSYRATFGDNGFPAATPDYYSAGYYDATFLLWRLYRDVKQQGGDVNDGAQLQAALEANPTALGVIGGDATTAGKTEFDPVTHGLKHQPMAVYRVHKGALEKVASSDIAGTGIQLLG